MCSRLFLFKVIKSNLKKIISQKNDHTSLNNYPQDIHSAPLFAENYVAPQKDVRFYCHILSTWDSFSLITIRNTSGVVRFRHSSKPYFESKCFKIKVSNRPCVTITIESVSDKRASLRAAIARVVAQRLDSPPSKKSSKSEKVSRNNNYRKLFW